MIRLVLIFVIIFTLIYGGIEFFKSLTKSEKWQLTKQIAYTTIISLLTTAVMFLIAIDQF